MKNNYRSLNTIGVVTKALLDNFYIHLKRIKEVNLESKGKIDDKAFEKVTHSLYRGYEIEDGTSSFELIPILNADTHTIEIGTCVEKDGDEHIVDVYAVKTIDELLNACVKDYEQELKNGFYYDVDETVTFLPEDYKENYADTDIQDNSQSDLELADSLHDISLINARQAEYIIDNFEDYHNDSVEGQFIAFDKNIYTAIDNTTHNAWTEDFRHLEVAIQFLNGMFPERAHKLDDRLTASEK